MKWNHILESQPEDSELIVQCDPAYNGLYFLEIKKYYSFYPFEEWLENCKAFDLIKPDFYWIYAKDFPFPDKT